MGVLKSIRSLCVLTCACVCGITGLTADLGARLTSLVGFHTCIQLYLPASVTELKLPWILQCVNYYTVLGSFGRYHTYSITSVILYVMMAGPPMYDEMSLSPFPPTVLVRCQIILGSDETRPTQGITYFSVVLSVQSLIDDKIIQSTQMSKWSVLKCKHLSSLIIIIKT